MTPSPMSHSSPAEILTAAGFRGEEFAYSDSSLGSMRGPCPKCGGTRRLLIFVDNPLPYWNWMCDQCSYRGKQLTGISPDLVGTVINPDRVEPDWSANIEELNNSVEWLEYHKSMTEENRAWYRARGIPDEYQDRWVLGYTPRKSFLFDKTLYQSAAYTIPKIDHQMRTVNIDYRLLDYPPKSGKYRSENQVPAAAFITTPGNTDLRRLFIVEGSIKAMVLCIFLEQHGWGDSQIIGLPGVKSKLYQEHVYQYPEAYVMLDPDSVATTKAVSRETSARPVFLPAKIDDAILGGLGWDSFVAVIRNSDL